jgi:hypothetical protein
VEGPGFSRPSPSSLLYSSRGEMRRDCGEGGQLSSPPFSRSWSMLSWSWQPCFKQFFCSTSQNFHAPSFLPSANCLLDFPQLPTCCVQACASTLTPSCFSSADTLRVCTSGDQSLQSSAGHPSLFTLMEPDRLFYLIFFFLEKRTFLSCLDPSFCNRPLARVEVMCIWRCFITCLPPYLSDL